MSKANSLPTITSTASPSRVTFARRNVLLRLRKSGRSTRKSESRREATLWIDCSASGFFFETSRCEERGAPEGRERDGYAQTGATGGRPNRRHEEWDGDWRDDGEAARWSPPLPHI